MGQERRLQLHELLVGILGSRNVYFQPPHNITMSYPAIVYERDNAFVRHADNGVYARKKRYQVTVIDENADSDTPDKLALQPYCEYVRHFTSEKLHHDVFNLYF